MSALSVFDIVCLAIGLSAKGVLAFLEPALLSASTLPSMMANSLAKIPFPAGLSCPLAVCSAAEAVCDVTLGEIC